MDYVERLRRLAILGAGHSPDGGAPSCRTIVELDAKSVEIARLGALIAVGGAMPSYGAQVDAALGVGATTSEIVDVLVAVAEIAGTPSVVDGAAKVALALGHDVFDASPDA
jgi:4-carboxymuconolactone decarboxylase